MTLLELNAHVEDGTIDETIRVEEARQRKALSKIADDFCTRPKKRLILLAGASSAGKTTTAKRLCTQLRVNGVEPQMLSTDDYFVGDRLNPRDENGELDYEHVECVDIRRLSADVNRLLAGEPIPQRRFDFEKHEGYFTETMLSLAKGGCVVIEGIHALNPRLTEGIDDEVKYRLFIDPQPDFEIVEGIVPTSAEARFLRRLVRDNQFRKTSPVRTLELWPKVLAGEKKWIEPFVGNADAKFNSYLPYEIAVLKPYVGGLLERVRREVGDDRLVMNMLRLIRPVYSAPMLAVPGDSILRETIGGSQLEY